MPCRNEKGNMMRLRHMRQTTNLPGRPPALLCRALAAACGLAMALTLALLPARVARAASTGTLTLSMIYEKSGKKTPVKGITVTVYRVASLDEGITHFTLLDPFTDLGYDFDQGMTARQNLGLADAANELVQEEKPSGTSATSNKAGTIRFGKLPTGMYLAVQTGATGDAKSYDEMVPFLISVPMITDDGPVYNVEAAPKLTPATDGDGGKHEGDKPPTKKPPTKTPQKPTTPTKPLVSTGDPTDPRMWAGCLAVGGTLVAAGILGRRKTEEE